MCDVITVHGKQYTHQSKIPEQGELILAAYQSGKTTILKFNDLAPGHRVIPKVVLTPYIEPGPWETTGKSYPTEGVHNHPYGISCEDGQIGLDVNWRITPEGTKEFLLDAVKQAHSMGIIKDYTPGEENDC